MSCYFTLNMKDEKLVNLIFNEEQSRKVIYLVFFFFFNKRRILWQLNKKIKTFFMRWKEHIFYHKVVFFFSIPPLNIYYGSYMRICVWYEARMEPGSGDEMVEIGWKEKENERRRYSYSDFHKIYVF